MKEHAIKCASRHHKYSGDQRNIAAFAKVMRDCDCDGYHTFNELYDHRITLFIAFCKLYEDTHFPQETWRSKLHTDGTMFDGQFILGIFQEIGKQITYHLPLSRWDETDFAQTLDRAPGFDGHTSDDVITRLKRI